MFSGPPRVWGYCSSAGDLARDVPAPLATMLSLIRQAGSLGQALRPELTQLARTVASAAGAAGGASKPVVEKEVRGRRSRPQPRFQHSRALLECKCITQLPSRRPASPCQPAAARAPLATCTEPARCFSCCCRAVPDLPLEPRLLGAAQVRQLQGGHQRVSLVLLACCLLVRLVCLWLPWHARLRARCDGGRVARVAWRAALSSTAALCLGRGC